MSRVSIAAAGGARVAPAAAPARVPSGRGAPVAAEVVWLAVVECEDSKIRVWAFLFRGSAARPEINADVSSPDCAGGPGSHVCKTSARRPR